MIRKPYEFVVDEEEVKEYIVAVLLFRLRVVNSFRLIILMLVLVIVYVFFATLCGYQSSFFFTMVNKEASDTIDDLKLNTVLINLSQDENTCLHCVETDDGFHHLRTLIEKQRIHIKGNAVLKEIRISFNILSITNMIVVLLVFNGPKLIFLVTKR